MRSLLFIDTETARFDHATDRIVQLNTRLVVSTGAENYCRRVFPNDDTAIPVTAAATDRQTMSQAAVKASSIAQALDDFARQLERADLVVGHGVDRSLAAIINAANRCGRHDLVASLTHPQFGFDAGRCAPICTQQLAAEYLTTIGEPLGNGTTELKAVYRRVFARPISRSDDPAAGVTTCHQFYQFLCDFQRKQDLQFSADIICFED